MAALAAEGVRLYALSYDEPDALRDFRDAYGISYTLLSDPDSEVIRTFGILNTLIAEDDHPWAGIPFPGTYVIDAGGRITHKFFENNLALRVGPDQLLRAVSGAPLSMAMAETRETAEPELDAPAPTVFLEGSQLAVGVLRDLVARFEVSAGRHLYAAGAPPGMVAVDLQLDEHPLLVTRPLQRPAAETHLVPGTGESLQVHHGTVELRLPVTVNGARLSDDATPALTLTGALRWQTCDDATCEVPRSQRFELTVPLQGSIPSELMGQPGEHRIRAMNGPQHFQKMIERRRDRD